MKLPKQQSREISFNAQVSPIDVENRTISFIAISEDTDVIRYGETKYVERLDVNGANFAMLKTFYKDHILSVDSAIGRVANARVEDNMLKVDVVFGRDPDSEAIFTKYLDGIIDSVSIGYSVYEYEKTGTKDGLPVYTITDFDVYELSAVWRPADKGAKIGRSMPIETEKQDPKKRMELKLKLLQATL